MVFHQDNTEQNYLGEFNHVRKYDPAVPHPMVVCAGDSLIEGAQMSRLLAHPPGRGRLSRFVQCLVGACHKLLK